MEAFRSQVAAAFAEALARPAGELEPLLSPPKDPAHGDLTLACFKLGKELGQRPDELARELARRLASGQGLVAHAEAAGPYVNVTLDPAAVARHVLGAVWSDDGYGGSRVGQGKTIVIDFSSPNVAKPFHLGHLRSTVIGWSLRQIFRAQGYRVIGVNHLGDWGTQFGLMIAAWKRWEPEATRRQAAGEPLIDLFVELYQRINREAEGAPAVREQGRSWFRRLEDGDPEARALWAFFVEHSKREFARIYDLLGIVHESEAGEAFYEDKMPATLERLRQAGLLVPGKTLRETALAQLEQVERKLEKIQKDEARLQAELEAARTAGAPEKQLEKLAKQQERLPKQRGGLEAELARARQTVPEGADDGLRPLGVELPGGGFCMLVKTDGTTTYATRDITAALYRAATYQPERILYVVGQAQADHFRDWFQVVERLGEPWAKGLVHVGFGNYLGLSTRRGRVVFLDDVLELARVKAVESSEAAQKKADLTPAEQDEVARAIGIAAVKFFDQRAERLKDIDLRKEPVEGSPLDLERVLNYKGQTGPYLEAAHARLAGILRKFEGALSAKVDFALFEEPETRTLIRRLAELPREVEQAALQYEPSVIARYAMELADATHAFIHHHRVLGAQPTVAQAARGVTPEAVTAARVFLVACAKKVLARALDLLGIPVLEKM